MSLLPKENNSSKSSKACEGKNSTRSLEHNPEIEGEIAKGCLARIRFLNTKILNLNHKKLLAERNIMRKTEISGLIILFVGVVLLIFTFLNAYWFLTQDIGLIATADLVKAFGEALAPLIATCIRVMYLGIMGWIGSLLTLRGISLLKEVPSPQMKVEKKLQQKPTMVSTVKREEIQKPQEKAELTKLPQKEIKPAASPPQRPEPPKSSEQPTPPEEKKEEKPTEECDSKRNARAKNV